jgi:hypothetical protein
MAERAYTITKKDPNGNQDYSIGLIDTNAAAANKLVTTDTTPPVTATGVRTIRAQAQYVKGSSTNGQLQLVVDGVVVADSGAASTTDGAILSIAWTGAIATSAYLQAVITGTATGASLNYARIGISKPVVNT